MKNDLKRSFIHFKKHKKLNYLRLGLTHNILLGIIFFLLIPFSILDLLIKTKFVNNIYVLYYGEEQPYKIIYDELRKNERFSFLKFNSFFIPIIPVKFLKDVLDIVLKEPMFFFKNINFFGAIALKISKYYFFIKVYKIKNLVVFQEYSFYMSYLTSITESNDSYLYNIMHGVPGKTYCFFRFSKCFVWGEYFKDRYIKYGASKSQFVISGSIYHKALLNYSKNNLIEPSIDILYVMAGAVDGYKDILEVISKFSKKVTVRVKQHPRYKIKLNTDIVEIEDDISHCINTSKIILGHYSTALLDAEVLGKHVISYMAMNQSKLEYCDFLDRKKIFLNKHALSLEIERLLRIEKTEKYNISNVIDFEKNPIEIILKEIEKN